MSDAEDTVTVEIQTDLTATEEPAGLSEGAKELSPALLAFSQEPADSEDKEQAEDLGDQQLAEDPPNELKDEDIEHDPGAISEPGENDVLNGRGASVNGHKGNQKFRALCFQRKPEFEAGNHAAKRRVATEIVAAMTIVHGRFLKRKSDKGPWFALSTEQAILKACQVMRDFQRPDRVQLREMQAQNGTRKRQRTTESTPGVSQLLQHLEQLPPINENPDGVHEHDVLSGRGAFVNGHSGNARFRTLAVERKPQFDSGNYSEKRALATEIVGMIRSLDPPGRFLKKIACALKMTDENWDSSRTIEGQWEELSDEKAIHKACQVMRDIARPDRVDGRRSKKKMNPEDLSEVAPKDDVSIIKIPEDSGVDATPKGSLNMLVENTADATTVQEAVAATTEEILDKALDGPDVNKPKDEEEEGATAEHEEV